MIFTHARLLVQNYKECFLFYRDVLGFEVGWGDVQSMYADFKTSGGFKIALFDRRFMAEAVGTGHLPADRDSMDTHCLVFRVDSVDESYRARKACVSSTNRMTEKIGESVPPISAIRMAI